MGFLQFLRRKSSTFTKIGVIDLSSLMYLGLEYYLLLLLCIVFRVFQFSEYLDIPSFGVSRHSKFRSISTFQVSKYFDIPSFGVSRHSEFRSISTFQVSE